MTACQIKSLQSRWWPDACRAQGWPRADRAFRLQIIGDIVHRPVTSCKDLNDTDDVDKLKRELLRCAHIVQMDTDQGGRERRLRHVAADAITCARLYLGRATDAYCRTALLRKFDFPGIDRDWLTRAAPSELCEMLDDSTGDKFSPLRQAVSTLWRIAHTHRKKHLESAEEMRRRAGLLSPVSPPTENEPF